jgi:hypothetical protein
MGEIEFQMHMRLAHRLRPAPQTGLRSCGPARAGGCGRTRTMTSAVAPVPFSDAVTPTGPPGAPPVTDTDPEVAASHSGRPVITLPANLGAWSLGVRTSEP